MMAGIVPGELGDRLGQFLQPAVVGEAAVVDRRVGPENHFQLACRAAASAAVPRSPRPAAPDVFAGSAVSGTTPSCTACRHQASKSAPVCCARPVALDDVVRARSGWSVSICSTSCADVPSYSGCNQRLLDRDRAVERARIAPGLQVMRLRQMPLAQFARSRRRTGSGARAAWPSCMRSRMPSSTGAL